MSNLIEEPASPDDGIVESAKAPPRDIRTESITPEEFVTRAYAKMEQQLQDSGAVVPPGHPNAPGLEPLPEKEPPVDPVDEPEEEVDEPVDEPTDEPVDEGEEEDQDDDFLINVGSSRYKTAEDAAKGVREKDLEIERLRLELQRQREEDEQREREQQQIQQLDVAAWEEWAEGAVAQGAGPSGALQALNQGGEAGYHLYLKHWMADDEQRADAVAFNNQVILQLAEQRAAKAVLPERQRNAVEDARTQAQLAQAQLAERYPDFNDLKAEMDRLIEEDGALDDDTKLWIADVAKTGLEGKKRAWEYLYLQAKTTTAPRKTQARSAESKRRRTSADAAKVAATVSTTEGNGTRTPPPAAEAYAVQRKNELRAAHGLPLLDEE